MYDGVTYTPGITLVSSTGYLIERKSFTSQQWIKWQNNESCWSCWSCPKRQPVTIGSRGGNNNTNQRRGVDARGGREPKIQRSSRRKTDNTTTKHQREHGTQASNTKQNIRKGYSASASKRKVGPAWVSYLGISLCYVKLRGNLIFFHFILFNYLSSGASVLQTSMFISAWRSQQPRFLTFST